MKHFPFRALTVDVLRRTVEASMTLVRNQMRNNGLLDKIRQNRRFIKPAVARRREQLRSVNRIYGMELARKIAVAREFYTREVRFK